MKLDTKNKIVRFIASKFLTPKTFIGRYVDNDREVKRFIADRNILVQNLFHIGYSLSVAGDFVGVDENLKPLIIAEQKRILKKELRKEKKCILIYVDDNLITRMLGWKETRDHYLLQGMEPDHLTKFINHGRMNIAK